MHAHAISVNASYNVGEYFSANRTSPASPNVYWMNNFESLYAAFGIHACMHRCVLCDHVWKRLSFI